MGPPPPEFIFIIVEGEGCEVSTVQVIEGGSWRCKGVYIENKFLIPVSLKGTK